MKFEIIARSSHNRARRGRLTTRHGIVETPVFMPVGTLGLVKSLDARDLDALGARITLANAYHLMLRPGHAEIAALGGVHRFAGLGNAILTDSGGYQVFSLAERRQVSDRGVIFQSHLDGRRIDLTPEYLVAVQEALEPDIAMVLDVCPPAKAPRDEVASAVARTTDWAKRCLAARTRADIAWFGIVQGALYEDLRAEHAEAIGSMPFDGIAIGGVSVGEDPDDIGHIVQHTAVQCPDDKPRYLMGVGTPVDLVRSVAAGIDMFDCVLPTRNARNGQLFTSRGRITIKNAAHRSSDAPIDPDCPCYTCRHVSRAFLRHLYVAGEITYHRLATLHNLTYYLGLLDRLRKEIEADQFEQNAWLARLKEADGR